MLLATCATTLEKSLLTVLCCVYFHGIPHLCVDFTTIILSEPHSLHGFLKAPLHSSSKFFQYSNFHPHSSLKKKVAYFRKISPNTMELINLKPSQ